MKGHALTTDQIALLSISVSLLSVLLACWSLNEARRARSENKNLTINLRKAELLTRLSDTTNIGYQVINVVHDCLVFAQENQLHENVEARDEVNSLLERKSEILEKIKIFDKKKKQYMKFVNFEFKEIEQSLAATYAQFKAWENEINLVNRSFNKVKRTVEKEN